MKTLNVEGGGGNVYGHSGEGGGGDNTGGGAGGIHGDGEKGGGATGLGGGSGGRVSGHNSVGCMRGIVCESNTTLFHEYISSPSRLTRFH